jgi:solute carrier family 25 (mitochondrial phosphate transporter), member 3
MAKFFCFEKIVQIFYTKVFTEPKESYSKPTQLGVTFTSGYLSGVICAIVSHPADSLVSQLGKPSNKGRSLGAIVEEIGWVALATKGLGTRIFMIGTLTGTSALFNLNLPTYLSTPPFRAGFQWWIYDSFKSTMGMGTTGGK